MLKVRAQLQERLQELKQEIEEAVCDLERLRQAR